MYLVIIHDHLKGGFKGLRLCQTNNYAHRITQDSRFIQLGVGTYYYVYSNEFERTFMCTSLYKLNLFLPHNVFRVCTI